jgi:tetratricopeptide (TPR) repeat protein
MYNFSTHHHSARKLIKFVSTLIFAAVAAILTVAFSDAASAQNSSKQKPTQKQSRNDETNRRSLETDRFDFLVREDFFAGLAGDQQRFDKAMKVCEEALAKNPKHAAAMVWHGAGVFTRAGWAFRKGDMRKGGELWQKGLDEMNAAVALEPAHAGVIVTRAAVLLEASKHAPMPAMARELLETAVQDYEKVMRLQQSYFDKLSMRARGELLLALGSGPSILCSFIQCAKVGCLISSAALLIAS